MWSETKLYKFLVKKTDGKESKMKNLLENPAVMKKIQLILDKAGTIPKDFTLHDSDHSYRVAERMWDLIPDKTKVILSEYELGFLLLSAYLHDIGMNPEYSKVQAHLTYITSEAKTSLTDDEVREFQKWIDDNLKSQPIDISKEKLTDSNTANYVITYYVRYKHNDWSGDWIKDNLSSEALELYPHWLEDLIDLCQSHHYGLEELTEVDFDPKHVKDFNIHLRYLAICLRTADVMENDPERTPEVILAHRSIAESSKRYWYKDHQIDLIRTENKFTIYSRPDKAYLHKAVLETADQIEGELKLCRRLIIDRPLSYSTYGALENYEWMSDAIIERDIEPRKGTYKYIEGSFRPNSERILELLGGSQLYGDPIWSLRELLQNAFDAVKEKIAYSVLSQNQDIYQTIEKYSTLNEIHLRLEKRDDGYWLVCNDSGVGMTDDIIENYFLVSGSSKRHELIALDRKCKERGFNMGRTGQFGIGALSYFMIASKLIIKTKRAQHTGYEDSKISGWRFEINGTHDFGELRKINWSSTGTEIELKLRETIQSDIKDWDVRFSDFLSVNISKSPCLLFYKSDLFTTDQKKISYGWQHEEKDLTAWVIKEFEKDVIASISHDFNDLLTQKRKNALTETLNNANTIKLSVEQKLRFLETKGTLPNDLGTFRIYIPYFELSKGKSFYFMHEQELNDTLFIDTIKSGSLWRPTFEEIYFSLKGISIKPIVKNDTFEDILSPYYINTIVQIDFERISETNLSVSRNNLTIEGDFIAIKKYIAGETEKLLSENKTFFQNIYDSLNSRITKSPIVHDYWLFSNQLFSGSEDEGSGKLIWKKAGYPLVTLRHPLSLSPKKLNYADLHIALPIKSYKNPYSLYFDRVEDYNSTYGLSIYVKEDNRDIPEMYTLCPIVLHPSGNISYLASLKEIAIPNEIKEVLFFKTYALSRKVLYINSTCSLKELFDYDTFNKFNMSNIQKLELKSLQTPADCFNCLIFSVMLMHSSELEALIETRRDLIQHIFAMLKIEPFLILDSYQAIYSVSNSELKSWSEDEIWRYVSKIKNPSFIISDS